jgi:hypothetical protein
MKEKTVRFLKNPVLGNIVLAQISFFLLLTLTVFITTKGFKNNRGLSFYGEHWSTAVTYGGGFILCDYFLLRAANALPKNKPVLKKLALLINILTVLLLGVLLTPDTLNSFFNWSHIGASTVLFLFELGFGGWLTILIYKDWISLGLLFLQFMAGVFAMLSQFHIVYYLSESSLFFQFFFGILLSYAVAKLLKHPFRQLTQST